MTHFTPAPRTLKMLPLSSITLHLLHHTYTGTIPTAHTHSEDTVGICEQLPTPLYVAGAQVAFSQSYYVVGEEEGWVEVGVTASGPSDTSYTVQVKTKSGSAQSKRNNPMHNTYTANTPAVDATAPLQCLHILLTILLQSITQLLYRSYRKQC